MSGPLVLVGSPEDEHVAAVAEAVRARGVAPVLFDSLGFPGASRLSMGDGLDEIVADGAPLARPAAVYLRGLYVSPLAYLVDVEEEMTSSWRKTMVVFQEKGELLLSLLQRWHLAGVPIYNPVAASEATRKPFQIARLAHAGVPVPRTLWTNDPEAVRRFAQGRRVAYKPIRGGAATKELRPEDLDERRLAALANAPVCFQELLPGQDVRVFVVDGRVAAAYRIEASALDYRQHEDRIESFEPDPATAETCVRAASVLGLRFTGIDLKGTSDGSLRVLEANPSPMFLGFDRRAGSDLLGALADALVSHVVRGERGGPL